MRVLIIESEPNLGALWRTRLSGVAGTVHLERDEAGAIRRLAANRYDVIVLNLVLASGSAFAVADFASYRNPSTRIVIVTGGPLFSDGSIFSLIPNASAFLPADTAPDDLAAVVEHHGKAEQLAPNRR